MRIGIGGGLGPFRAGISTRGIGIGVGPISAGGSWKGRRRSSKSDGTALAFAAALVFLAIAWPYFLGTWVAVKFGAGLHSTERTVVGWVFEVIYLLLLVGLAILVFIGNALADQQQAAERERQALEDQERREREAIARERHELEAQRANIRARVANARAVVARIGADPTGVPDDRVPAAERLLGTFSGVSLLEPRVTHRGGPKEQTAVDEGELLVSDHAVRFRGVAKHREWRWQDLVDCKIDDHRVLLPVKSRGTISGFEVAAADDLAARSCVSWALALPDDVDALTEHLIREIDSVEQALGPQDAATP